MISLVVWSGAILFARAILFAPTVYMYIWIVQIRSLKVHLHEIFFLVFCTDNTYIGQIIRLWVFSILFLNSPTYANFFNIRRWLRWRGVSFPVNRVNAEWNSMLTESMQRESPRHLSQHGMMESLRMLVLSALTSWREVSLHVDSVDMESHSALTQLTGSLTLHWLSWQGVSLSVDLVCRR
jgi:hypothetical protein